MAKEVDKRKEIINNRNFIIGFFMSVIFRSIDFRALQQLGRTLSASTITHMSLIPRIDDAYTLSQDNLCISKKCFMKCEN
jgi:hypothetical protein